MDKDENKKPGKGMFTKIIMGFVTILLIVFMFPKGESIEFEVSEGSVWLYDDLIAPFSFPIMKSEELYRAEVEEAKRTVYPIFFDEITNKQKSIESLTNYNTYLVQVLDESIETESSSIANPTFLTTPSFLSLQNLRVRDRNLINSGVSLKSFFNSAAAALRSVYTNEVLSIESGVEVRDTIAVRKGNFDTVEPINKNLFYDQAKKLIVDWINKSTFSEELKAALSEYTLHFLLPSLVYSTELTEEETTQAQNNVSRYTGIVNENERIIARHDRITKDIKLKIESYKESKGELIGSGAMILQSVGKFFHIGLILSLLVTYLYLIQERNIF